MTELKWNEYNYCQSDLDLRIVISSNLMAQIVNLAFQNDNLEHGGFLIGKYPETNKALIEMIASPYKEENDQFCYTRFTDGMKEFWDDLYDKTGMFYLGEWHSHPNVSSLYSNTDRRAMIEISQSDTVRIKYPIFMIIGQNKTAPEISFYTVTNNKIYKYERR